MKIKLLLSGILIYCMACNNSNKQYKSPQGYDLNQPEKFTVPSSLSEISGITFSNDSNDTIYAVQDEEGKLFHFKTGDKYIATIKFAKKGDYEDLAITNNTAIVLRSDGSLFSFSFPLPAIFIRGTDSVQEWKDLIPKAEYEGMYADDSSNIFILCKACDGKQINGYILKLTEGTITNAGNFVIDVKAIETLAGDKKLKFRPSAMAKNTLTKEWFILSSVNKLLVITDNNWTVKAVYTLDPTLFNQPEGIAFDNNANLFISNEAGDAGQGNILKFNYKKP